MTRSIKALAFCSILLILGTLGQPGSAADVSSRKIDEFKGRGWESAMARLDNFALELQNNPSSVGVIHVYGGQNRARGEASAWSSCLRDYLVTRRGFEASRLIVVMGGYRDDLAVELWSVQDRTNLPKPTPTIESGTVKFKGSTIKQWRRMCSL